MSNLSVEARSTAAPSPVGGGHPATSVPTFALRIAGLGSALPDRRVTNDDLAATLDTSDAWISSRTGIRARRVAGPEDTTVALATNAARRALVAAGVEPEAVDLVVVATSTPDSPCPSTAARVAGELGVSAGGFDLNGACTGFVHALHTAAALLSDPGIGTALVIGAERYLSLVDPTDRTTAVLFGDGAGAAVIVGNGAEPGAAGILASDLGGDPTGVAVLEVPPGRAHLHMDGPELFRRATRGLVASATATLDRAGATPADVDLYVAHQANARIVAAAAGRIGIPTARVVFDMGERANTSAASVPLALDAAATSGALRPGMLVLISAIGAGLGWSTLLMRWAR